MSFEILTLMNVIDYFCTYIKYCDNENSDKTMKRICISPYVNILNPTSVGLAVIYVPRS